MRKKLVAVLACGVLATGMLAGCGSDDKKDTSTDTKATAEATAAPTEEATEEPVEDTTDDTTDETAEATGLSGQYVATMLMSDADHAMTISDYTEQSGDETYASIEGATLVFVDDANVNAIDPAGNVEEATYTFDGQALDITDSTGTESYEYNAESDYITYAIAGQESTMYVVFSHQA